MKVYYQIPDDLTPRQTKMVSMLYENMKLRILLAVSPYKRILSGNEMVIIKRSYQPDEIIFRYENFTPATKLIVKTIISQINMDKIVKC